MEEWTNPPGYVLLRARGTKSTHGRPPHMGQMGSADHPGKMDEKLKSENVQERAVFYVYVIF